MVAQVRTATLIGVEAHPIEVEVEFSQGLPTFAIIGLGDTAVHEARFRIHSSIRAAQLDLPHKKITINLAPAAMRKDGAALDLAMALGILVEAGHLDPRSIAGVLVSGELALTGTLRPVRGALAMAALARRLGLRQVIVPAANGFEARAIGGVEVLAPQRLSDLVAHLRGEAVLPAPIPVAPQPPEREADLSEVRGQGAARRALEIAAAGGHNLLLVGPPGSGKTMLARRMASILPPLELEEQIEVTKIWSAAGLKVGPDGLVARRPIRAPHHSISEAGLVGGGAPIRPGEVSLAHQGVLFLDEMPELPRRVLESLRQPLEDREVTIVRARQAVRMPASFILIGAANPCPCGWHGDPSRRCSCTSDEMARYRARLSGPLLDRIDMVVEAPSISPDALLSGVSGESSALVRERVVKARAYSKHRPAINALLSMNQLEESGGLSSESRALLIKAMDGLGLSARVLNRTIRVARTISDLEDRAVIGAPAIAEALRYRAPSGWVPRSFGATHEIAPHTLS